MAQPCQSRVLNRPFGFDGLRLRPPSLESRTMNRLFVLAALFLLAGLARAQIEVRATLEREYFLPGETLEVAVRVANFTGGPLTLGTRRDWVRFTVESTDGGVVKRLKEAEETGAFTLEHATAGTLRFDLAPQFALDRPGSFRVVAEVISPAGNETFTSAPARFDIVSGVRLNQDREIGVPMPDGRTERRKYILQQVNFLEKLQLYLRVTDATESRTFKVTPLGGTVSFDPPRWVVDRENQFHVLHRINASQIVYHVFQPDGTLSIRRIYRFVNSKPELRVNDDGEIAVMGGVRQITRADIPPPQPAEVPDSRDSAPADGPQNPTEANNDTKKDGTP